MRTKEQIKQMIDEWDGKDSSILASQIFDLFMEKRLVKGRGKEDLTLNKIVVIARAVKRMNKEFNLGLSNHDEHALMGAIARGEYLSLKRFAKLFRYHPSAINRWVQRHDYLILQKKDKHYGKCYIRIQRHTSSLFKGSRGQSDLHKLEYIDKRIAMALKFLSKGKPEEAERTLMTMYNSDRFYF